MLQRVITMSGVPIQKEHKNKYILKFMKYVTLLLNISNHKPAKSNNKVNLRTSEL